MKATEIKNMPVDELNAKLDSLKDEALDAFLHDFSGDIERTQRKGGTVVYTKIRALLSEGSSQIERLAVFQRETHLPFVVCHAGG